MKLISQDNKTVLNYSKELEDTGPAYDGLNPASPETSPPSSPNETKSFAFEHNEGTQDPYIMAADDPDLQGAKGCCKRTGLFTGYAVQDIMRNKCHFCLAFGSVFVVVLSILIVQTIVSMGPLVFLSLGQKTNGEIDAIFSPISPGVHTATDYAAYQSLGQFLNYTQVTELYGSEYNLAPRVQTLANLSSDASEKQISGHMTLIMTDREKEMELGIAYPYGPLA